VGRLVLPSLRLAFGGEMLVLTLFLSAISYSLGNLLRKVFLGRCINVGPFYYMLNGVLGRLI
jgi:hypothetical protein